MTLFVCLSCRVQQLERDLYYYKKTSRDLKKKMRELLASGALGQYRGEDLDLHNSVQSSIGEHEPVAPNSHREHISSRYVTGCIKQKIITFYICYI